MNEKVKSYLKEECKGFLFYVNNNFVRCVRAGIEATIMCTLMISWIDYVMKPCLNDSSNYGVSSGHFDPIVVLCISGFVILSFVFLLTFGWSYLHKYLRLGFNKYEKPEQHYKTEVELK